MSEFDPAATAYSTKAVVRGKRPILLVVHQEDGNWQFLDGGTADLADGVAIHLAHVVDANPDLAPLADLPRGWAAERISPAASWQRYAWPEGPE